MFIYAAKVHGTKGLGQDEVRLAYVLNVDDLNKAMDCLEKALEVYKREEMAEQEANADAKLV